MSQYIYDNDELIDTKNNIIIKYEDVIDVIHELENKNDKLSKYLLNVFYWIIQNGIRWNYL